MSEREEISRSVVAGDSIRSIAKKLGRAASTISREIERNGDRTSYRASLADRAAWERAHRPQPCKLVKNRAMAHIVAGKLKMAWSPEQIAGTLPHKYSGWTISHEAIYRYIYAQYAREGYGRCIGQDLRIYLKRKHKVRKRKKIPFKKERGIKNHVSIDERPVVVDERIELGHWEGNSIVSRKSLVCLNTLVERDLATEHHKKYLIIVLR